MIVKHYFQWDRDPTLYHEPGKSGKCLEKVFNGLLRRKTKFNFHFYLLNGVHLSISHPGMGIIEGAEIVRGTITFKPVFACGWGINKYGIVELTPDDVLEFVEDFASMTREEVKVQRRS